MTKPGTLEDSTGQPLCVPSGLGLAWGQGLVVLIYWRNLLTLRDLGPTQCRAGAKQGSLYQICGERCLLVANWASQESAAMESSEKGLFS